MQQAIYTNINPINISPVENSFAQKSPVRKTTLLRHLALKWDLYGVVALLLSTGAYGVFALAHVA